MVSEWTKQNATVMNSRFNQGYTFKERENQDFSRQYSSPYIQRGCSINEQGGSSLLAASNRNSLPSLVNLEQTRGIVYPGQMSSQWCKDMGPCWGRSTVSGTFSIPTSGYSDWIRHGELGENSRTLNHVGALSSSSGIVDLKEYIALLSNRAPEDTIAALSSSKAFARPMLSREIVSRCGFQALQSNQCYSQPCPPPAPVGPFTVVQKNIHNKAQYSSVDPKNTLQHGFCNVQAPKPADLICAPHNVLVLYLSEKYNITDACKSQQEFLALLHLAVCSGVECKCEKYSQLITHLDNCRNAPCVTCGPVRELCMENLYVTTQPAKRVKTESDDWSLGAIVRQSLMQPSEVRNSVLALNNEIPRNHDFDEKKKGNENGVAHCEEKNTRVDEQQETGKDNTNEVIIYGQSWDFDVISPEEFLIDEDEAENNTNWISEAKSEPGKNLEDLKVSGNSVLALNNEIPRIHDFDEKKKGNENGVAHCEEKNTRVDEQQETGKDNSDEVIIYGQSWDFYAISPEEFLIDEDEAENTNWISEAKSEPGKKLEDLKVSGVSLIDFFVPEQIKEHLHSLNQRINLSAGNGLNGDRGVCVVDENTCQLCCVGGRTFSPPPLYCSCCGARVKHGVIFYRPLDDGTDVNYIFCTKCHKAFRTIFSFRGLSFSKEKLEKCKYSDEYPEGWVQCDKCEAWQHQICALYNSKQDLEGKLDYICPFCRLSEIEAKGHVSIPPAFRARDLPRTKLSDHIEQRLFKSLERERKQRADISGKSPEELTGVEDLVVRVVLAVNKELKVKQQFLDILHGEPYPTEFPYKSKVLLLFQKVGGVDVCIFAMYLQEFGSECGQPNKRSIYISYLDSVKYFSPEIKTVDGVALRTFVYHEILIGYLDYCKQHGFTTCYIWACPPTKGEDYILYCHPETQKTPNPHKLLQWYKKLLRKAKEEDVVVEYTNFYDSFFVPIGECNSKITAARLPYFDGDYWSCAIEDTIRVIEKEESEGKPEGKSKILPTKRTFKAMGHTDLSVDKTKDIFVMQKLGQSILPKKEEFFVVHLQFTCINCHEPILSGSRWSCSQCSRFHLCRRCLELEWNSTGLGMHTSVHGEKHKLFEVPVNNAAADTEDEDILLENDLFDNRQSFLKFCQDNHYQFDSLRRAKHSSMMILHQLKNTVCSIFHQDLMSERHFGS